MKVKQIIIKRFVQAAPAAMIVVMSVIYVVFLKDMTIEQILSYTPEAPAAAAAVIAVMYALKSLSYFFPMMIIAAAAGIIFPIYIAIPVNLAGIIIMASIPFAVGRYAESELVDKLAEKYGGVEQIRSIGMNHQLFGAFFLRIISCLPYDIVSIIMGSMRFEYKKYILGTFLGTFPGIILTTIMGSSIREPFSPEFIICASIEIVIAVCSALVYRAYLKKHRM